MCWHDNACDVGDTYEVNKSFTSEAVAVLQIA